MASAWHGQRRHLRSVDLDRQRRRERRTVAMSPNESPALRYPGGESSRRAAASATYACGRDGQPKEPLLRVTTRCAAQAVAGVADPGVRGVVLVVVAVERGVHRVNDGLLSVPWLRDLDPLNV